MSYHAGLDSLQASVHERTAILVCNTRYQIDKIVSQIEDCLMLLVQRRDANAFHFDTRDWLHAQAVPS